MRVVSFEIDGEPRLGVRTGEEVVDLAIAAPRLPHTLRALLESGREGLSTARAGADSAAREARRPLAGLRFCPPVIEPSKILCLGTNFFDHAAEGAKFLGEEVKRPDFPPVFMRAPSSLIGHREPMIRPDASEQLDYEAELAVVIGTRCRHVSAAEALSHVAGYSCFNDGSIRDFQLRTSQWTLGKNFDGTGGFGPELVTPEELPPGASGLRLQTRLNGKIMQDANTRDMIFGVAEAIAILTEGITLEPGDVIIMGTCAGVGLVRKPPVFMKPGDRCEIEIEGIGVLSNPIVQEERNRRL